MSEHSGWFSRPDEALFGSCVRSEGECSGDGHVSRNMGRLVIRGKAGIDELLGALVDKYSWGHKESSTSMAPIPRAKSFTKRTKSGWDSSLLQRPCRCLRQSLF